MVEEVQGGDRGKETQEKTEIRWEKTGVGKDRCNNTSKGEEKETSDRRHK